MADPISGPPFPWPEKFAENKAKFPIEELWKHKNQFVAWNWDGTQIVASAPTREELTLVLERLGADFERTIVEFVEDPDVSYIGGLL